MGMSIRNEIIERLENLAKHAVHSAGEPPLVMSLDDGIALHEAIELLKAQEPVAPIFDYDGRDVWLCGNCHRTIFHPTRTDEDENEKNYRRFCFHCGRAVKWE